MVFAEIWTVKKLFKAVKLLFQGNKLLNELERENKMGYDWKIGFAKALRDFAITCAAVLTAYFAVPDNLVEILKSLPGPLQQAAIPLLSSLFVFLHNWINNRNS